MKKARDIAAVACLAILLLANGRRFRRWELKRRFVQLAQSASLSLDEARLAGSDSSADPEYSEFLLAIRERVPPTSSVAVSTPRVARPLIYNARYVLAPREVLPLTRAGEAEWVALFHPDFVDQGAIAIPRGVLRRVR